MVKSFGMFSVVFYIKSGIGQSRLNSLWFFNVNVNDLIVKLRNSGFGSYFGFAFADCLFLADDILVLSSSILHLQCMLELCGDFGIDYDKLFNQKSHFYCKLV